MLNARNCNAFSRSPTYSTEKDSTEVIDIALMSFKYTPVLKFDPVLRDNHPYSRPEFPS